jgi:hypothetical protein
MTMKRKMRSDTAVMVWCGGRGFFLLLLLALFFQISAMSCISLLPKLIALFPTWLSSYIGVGWFLAENVA